MWSSLYNSSEARVSADKIYWCLIFQMICKDSHHWYIVQQLLVMDESSLYFSKEQKYYNKVRPTWENKLTCRLIALSGNIYNCILISWNWTVIQVDSLHVKQQWVREVDSLLDWHEILHSLPDCYHWWRPQLDLLALIYEMSKCWTGVLYATYFKNASLSMTLPIFNILPVGGTPQNGDNDNLRIYL